MFYYPLHFCRTAKTNTCTPSDILNHEPRAPTADGLNAQCAVWQAREKRHERESHVAKAQMEAALSRGVSWGLSEDAEVDPGEVDADNIDWRAYSQTHTFTDKQVSFEPHSGCLIVLTRCSWSCSHELRMLPRKNASAEGMVAAHAVVAAVTIITGGSIESLHARALALAWIMIPHSIACTASKP